MSYTVPCPHCDQPTHNGLYGHICDDCQVMRDHEPEGTWTVIDKDCVRGFPACVKGDGHAEGCVGR